MVLKLYTFPSIQYNEDVPQSDEFVKDLEKTETPRGIRKQHWTLDTIYFMTLASLCFDSFYWQQN